MINAISGWIASTDSDNDGEYDNNQDCLWTLNAEPNHVVLFRVMQLDLEWTHNCEYDYIKVSGILVGT